MHLIWKGLEPGDLHGELERPLFRSERNRSILTYIGRRGYIAPYGRDGARF